MKIFFVTIGGLHFLNGMKFKFLFMEYYQYVELNKKCN